MEVVVVVMVLLGGGEGGSFAYGVQLQRSFGGVSSHSRRSLATVIPILNATAVNPPADNQVFSQSVSQPASQPVSPPPPPPGTEARI
jgi:hypothetical protein